MSFHSGLWGWQSEVMAAYATVGGDAAVELPTGTGKTLIGLLAGEHFRDTEGAPVAYLAGNKQLAQQVERAGRVLAFPVVRFQGSKDTWVARDVRAFNFGEAIGDGGGRVVSCPSTPLADDLLNGVEPLRPPEMLVFPDSAELAAASRREGVHSTIPSAANSSEDTGRTGRQSDGNPEVIALAAR